MNRSLFLHVFAVVLMVSVGSASLWAQSGRAAAGSESRFTIEPYTRVVLGSTEYVLLAPGVKSRLEFPLNSLVLGVRTAYVLRSGGPEELRFHLSAGTSVSGPWGVLKDHDWYLVGDVPPIKFSYTESEAEMFFFEAGAGAEKLLFSADEAHVFGSLGYSYQHISQNALGYSGWQYVVTSSGDADNPPTFELYYSNYEGKALEYTIAYHRVAAGGVLRWRPYQSLELELGLLPQLMYVTDRDDHVLRNKLSTAAGFGGGVEGTVSLSYRWPGTPDYQSYVSVSGGLLYLRALTKQTQEWYGDDPGIAGDQTGRRITGITHIIQTLQGSVSLSAGVWYR